MLKNILKLEGVSFLKKGQQKSIKGKGLEEYFDTGGGGGGAACNAYCGGGVFVYCYANPSCSSVPGQGCYTGSVFNSCP